MFKNYIRRLDQSKDQTLLLYGLHDCVVCASPLVVMYVVVNIIWGLIRACHRSPGLIVTLSHSSTLSMSMTHHTTSLNLDVCVKTLQKAAIPHSSTNVQMDASLDIIVGILHPSPSHAHSTMLFMKVNHVKIHSSSNNFRFKIFSMPEKVVLGQEKR